jgi:membrane fusion protein (multidrug efflux system)
MPPTEVTVMQVTPRRVEQQLEFAGNVEASRRIQVRSAVGGIIMARLFQEGQAVHAGDVLYRVDPTAFDADFRAATARLSEAEARAQNADQHLARLTGLLKENAISRQDFDNATTEAKQAHAGVDEAKGVADRARKNLTDAQVRAEVSGRVGKAWLEVGARTRGTDDVLTTIDVLDPVYVSFRPSAQQLLDWRSNPATAKVLLPGGSLRVRALLPDGSLLPAAGKVGFVDPVVDPATGTQQFRADFPNANQALLPGQFVRVRLEGIAIEGALLVPQRAVLQQMGRQTVFVVGAGDTVQVRPVTATTWNGGEWLISQGLSAGDRVIVDGVQKVGPGSKVHPTLAMDSTATPAAGKKP